MRAPRPSPHLLLLMGSLSVLALMGLSDFKAMEVDGIGELGDGPGVVSVIVLSCRPCTGGFLMEVDDGMGGRAMAFCPHSLLPDGIVDGTLARVTLLRSSEDPEFFVVKALELSDRP